MFNNSYGAFSRRDQHLCKFTGTKESRFAQKRRLLWNSNMSAILLSWKTNMATVTSCENTLLLVFSVTPFKIDQNKNKNRSIDKVQNLGNERRYIYKDPRQDSGQRNLSYTRYPKKCFTQKDLYGDAMLVLTWMSSNMADGNQQKHLLLSFVTKAWIYSSRNS